MRTHADGFSALRDDKIDAYASDRLILVGLALSGIDVASYRLSDEMFSYEPYALMMRRDADFKVAVDRELARLVPQRRYFEPLWKMVWSAGRTQHTAEGHVLSEFYA